MITMIRSSLLPYYRISARRLPPASSGSLMNSPGTIVSRRPRPTQRQPVESFSSSAATSSSSASSSEMPPIIWTTHRLTKEQILKVDQIFHKILWLDIFESQMLNDLVNEKLGIVLTKKQRKQLQAVMTALDNEDEEDNAAGAVQAEEEAKPILMDLKLAGFDASAKIKVIKEVRAALGLGLKEAKELVESAPVPLQKNMQPEAAAALKEKLEAAGATIELVEV